MNNYPIFIVGSTGYVGSEYIKYFNSNNIKYHCVHNARSNSFLDELNAQIKTFKPRYLINAAGFTGKPNVDACETDKGECLKGNTILPYEIAKICKEHDVVFGHVSSGCIYTGTKGSKGFTELDPPNFTFKQNNCSYYSGTKALGEELLEPFDNTYIWRLRIPFNNIHSPRNYLSKLQTYKTLLNADNSISHLGEFVAATVQSLLKDIPKGIYNVTNTGFVSTNRLVDLLQKYNLPTKNHKFEFFTGTKEFMCKAAKTPRSNCILDNSKLLNAGIYMSNAYDAVERCLSDWVQS